jgi:hypothetical protein
VERPAVYAEDKRGKEDQAAYYNKRHGARKLKELRVGDHVLVWDIQHRNWRILAVVIKIINSRSFVVKLEGGVPLRRNRHQLQWRPPGLRNKRPLDGTGVFDDEIQKQKGERTTEGEGQTGEMRDTPEVSCQPEQLNGLVEVSRSSKLPRDQADVLIKTSTLYFFQN